MSQCHQVVLTFDIDENKVAENAEREAGRQIAGTLLQKVFGSSYVSEWKFKSYVQTAINDIMAEEKEQIIQASIEELTKALSKTKVVKERLQEALDAEK